MSARVFAATLHVKVPWVANTYPNHHGTDTSAWCDGIFRNSPKVYRTMIGEKPHHPELDARPAKAPEERAFPCYLSEFIGTFSLVFAGTGAIITNDLSDGAVTHPGVAMTFGLVIMTMIYAVGDISGAHFNPAVTYGFWLDRRFPSRQVAPYIASQCLGALCASALLRLMFQEHPTLGATIPTGSITQSAGLECVLTFVLMFVIIRVATGSKEQGIVAGIAIGGTVALAALFGGPISGASMNPARSLGPACLAVQWDALWLYLLVPFVGAHLAIVAHRAIGPKTNAPPRDA
jgi:MIP family channel proteins